MSTTCIILKYGVCDLSTREKEKLGVAARSQKNMRN